MQAVLFDLWETLITDNAERGRARQLWRAANVRAVLDAAGTPSEAELIETALNKTLRGLALSHDRGEDTDAAGRIDLFLQHLVELGGTAPNSRTHEALVAAICTMPEGLYPGRMPGAVETLTAVRAQGLKTGLVSNAGVTTAPTLRLMLDSYELSPLLDALVFSDEVLLGKPSAGIFTAALDALEVEAAETVFVGDSPLHDIAGAQAAGMRTVQIGAKTLDGIVPDARIDTLAELLQVLPGLDTARATAGG